MIHSAATSLKNADKMFAASLISSGFVQTLAFKKSARSEMGVGSWGRTRSSSAVSAVVPRSHPKRELHLQSHLPLQIHGEGSLPGLPNLLGSTVNILINPSPCIYRGFLETALVPSWNEINFQSLGKTERYSLPGSERLIVGEPVQPSHSSPAACAKGRVLWGLFTQRAPQHLPAHRPAR